jgi:hypothetical protein
MIPIETIYSRWESGDLPSQEAIEQLVSQLAAVEDSLEPLEQTKQAIRAKLSLIVDRQPGSAIELPGYGKLAIRSATVTKSYDKDKLDQLIIQLAMDGQVELAQAIGGCKKESSRSGGLVITRTKETGE